MNQPKYVDASVQGRAMFVLVLGLFFVSFFFNDILNIFFPIPELDSLSTAAIDFRNLLSAIIATCLICPTVVYTIVISLSARRYMEYPTPGMNLPFRQRVLSIENPSSIWVVASVTIASLFLQLVLMWYSWYMWHNFLKEISIELT